MLFSQRFSDFVGIGDYEKKLVKVDLDPGVLVDMFSTYIHVTANSCLFGKQYRDHAKKDNKCIYFNNTT